MTERLIGSAQVSQLLGVTPSAVTNWRKRGTGPLPEPAYSYRTQYGKVAPLWTVEQIEEVIAVHSAKMQEAIDSMRSNYAR